MMPLELHTLITALFPPTRGIRLLEISIEDESVWLQLTATAPTAACPRCAVSSSSVHSRYQRRLTDLPWGTRAVRIQLTVRKFRCRNRACGRRIFTERLSDLVAAYSRKTHRLATALRMIGMALGGEAGARLAARLRLPTSSATLLRLVQAAPVPRPPALQAVGIDEWAWRRGHHITASRRCWSAAGSASGSGPMDGSARIPRLCWGPFGPFIAAWAWPTRCGMR